MRGYSLTVLLALLVLTPGRTESLPGSNPLTTEGDLAEQMVAGIDRYLMREIADSVPKRKTFWHVDRSSPDAYDKSVQPNRERLKAILGVIDPRVRFREPEQIATLGQTAVIAQTDRYKVLAIRWPVLPGVDGEGLLLEPAGKVEACLIALPDADSTPEMLAGLAPGRTQGSKSGNRPSELVRGLAENGCRIVIPTLIDRQDTYSGSATFNRWTNQPHREFIYRMAYEMGRHILGYEIQKVLATVDWFARMDSTPPIGVIGYGEGGLVALYSAAVDPRIQITFASGCFAPWENTWEQPIYRNVWRLLREFGAAEVCALQSAQGKLLVEAGPWPDVKGPPPPRPGRAGAAPGSLVTPDIKVVQQEFDRLQKIGYPSARKLLQPDNLQAVLREILPTSHQAILPLAEPPADQRKGFDPSLVQKRQFDQLVQLTQRLMRDAEHRRAETFWSKLDPSSPEKYAASCTSLREQLAEVIGKLPTSTTALNPRTRQILDEPGWRGYEVVHDVYPDVFAFGILLLPKDLKPGEKRPVVVCQHGLEGRPIDVVNPKMKTRAYNSFGAQLADRGYIVYAPQNPYIGQDRFRVLQRKGNLLGLSLFSFIVRQHERTLDWLESLPWVDPSRIAFYGLSYGGKTAMRVPALVSRYCLSICSGDFNEWTWKNVSVDFRGSYMWSGEYEMPEFNLGSTIVYAEMAALIAPRPFMVERGHDDGVGIDEWVAYEYAKVRRHYSRLKIPEQTEIEFFAGGHVINGQGTFRFLDKHLRR